MFFSESITKAHIDQNEQKAFTSVIFLQLGEMMGNWTLGYQELPTECVQCPRLSTTQFHGDFPRVTGFVCHALVFCTFLTDESAPLAPSGRLSATGFPNTISWILFHTADKMDGSVDGRSMRYPEGLQLTRVP